MGTAKAGSENRPILGPADAVFYPHPNRTQLLVERFLLYRQFSTLRFLKGCPNDEAWHLLLHASLSVTDRHESHLLRQTLITFVGIGFTTIG